MLLGTEVFELNVHLRNKVLGIAQMANLTDSTTARNYRAHYPKAPANKSPQVFKGDTETSDGTSLVASSNLLRDVFHDANNFSVYWHGAVL
jgi:purine nucleoside permease